MDQLSDAYVFFSRGIKLLSNYYDPDAGVRLGFADALQDRLREAEDEDNRLLRLDMTEYGDFAGLLRAVCLALGCDEAGRQDLTLSALQRLTDSLDEQLADEEKCVCLLLENFQLCAQRWTEPDFGWFRELLYHSEVFSCVTVSDRHIELFAHVPSLGSALSNIFTVAERIGGGQ